MRASALMIALSGQALTAFRTAASQNLTAGFRCEARAETMATGANNAGWLECTFHGSNAPKIQIRPVL